MNLSTRRFLPLDWKRVRCGIEAAALTVLYGRLAFGQIALRRIDGAKHLPSFLEKTWQKGA